MFFTTLNAEKLWQSLKNWAKFDLQITSSQIQQVHLYLSFWMSQATFWDVTSCSLFFPVLSALTRQADTCSQQKYYTCAYGQGLIQLFEASRSRQTHGIKLPWLQTPRPTLPVLWLPLRTHRPHSDCTFSSGSSSKGRGRWRWRLCLLPVIPDKMRHRQRRLAPPSACK